MSGGAVRRLLPTSTESDGRGAQGGQAPPARATGATASPVEASVSRVPDDALGHRPEDASRPGGPRRSQFAREGEVSNRGSRRGVERCEMI